MTMGATRPPDQPLLASWEPNLRPMLPSVVLCVAWLFVLSITLPSRSRGWRLVRIASFFAIAALILPLSFDHRYTLGNPLRDVGMPILAWNLICKAVEICLVYSKGGPRPIRPFLPKSSSPVPIMKDSEYAQYEWKVVGFPKLFSCARVCYGLDVLGLRRVGTSPILPGQGRALEWSLKGLNEWSRHLKANRCRPEDVAAHGPVRRFGQAESPLLVGVLQAGVAYWFVVWLYALASPTSEVISILGLFIPVGSAESRRIWHNLVPHHMTKHLVLLGVPTSAFDLPVPTRVVMVLGVGSVISFVPSLAESVLLVFWKPRPATSFLSSFERPLTSTGIARIWSRSWHATSQRDYLNLASLMPLAEYEAIQLLWVFFWSGVQHSWMLARLRIPSSAPLTLENIVTGMIEPGMAAFFLAQGAGILVERAAVDAMPMAWKKQHTLVAIAKRLWMLAVLVLPGFLFLDSIMQRRLLTKDILDGFRLEALGMLMMGHKYELG